MNNDFLTLDKRHPLGEIATGVIAHFSGPLSLLFLVVECSPRPLLACSAHLRLQAGTVSQANRMRFETPATPHTCPTAVSRIMNAVLKLAGMPLDELVHVRRSR